MGYSYDMQGRLCCDACPTSGGVRKVKCPFGYCPAVALCAECKKKHADKLTKAHHRERGCEAGHLRCVREANDRKEKLNAGKLVLKAAVGFFDGTGRVKVTFEKLENGTVIWKDYVMHESIYDQRPSIFENPTLEFFQALGEVQPIA